MMGLFKAMKDPLPEDRLDTEERRAAVFRLTQEMEDLASQLVRKATELKEEIARGKS